MPQNTMPINMMPQNKHPVRKPSRKLLSLMPMLALSLLTGRVHGQAATSQWPQRLESPAGLITVYEPQPDKFDGNTLTARAAVSLTPTGAKDPEFGAMWFQSRVATDRDARAVFIQDVQVKRVKLPNASDDQDKQFGQVVQQSIPSMKLVLSLDQLEATLSVVQKAKEDRISCRTIPRRSFSRRCPPRWWFWTVHRNFSNLKPRES